MAHYAFIDDNNIVTSVIVGKDENEEGIDWEVWYTEFVGQTCKRTSYNTTAGVHKNGGIPFRYNYAGIGYSFDPSIGTDGAFISPKTFDSWVLDLDTCTWKSPVPKPTDESTTNQYRWNEETLAWESVANA